MEKVSDRSKASGSTSQESGLGVGSARTVGNHQEPTRTPFMLTADEVARDYLRTSRKVIYEMISLGQLPGVVRLGRKILIRRDRLLQFLRERESSVSSLGDSE